MACNVPNQPYHSARGIRRSPLHQSHVAANAVFEHVAGWEQAAVFAPAGAVAATDPTYGRQRWHDWCAEECKAARSGAAVVDQSALAKVLVVGRDAIDIVGRIVTIMPKPGTPAPRSLILHPEGTIDAIVQVVLLAQNRVLILAPAGEEVRLAALVTRRLTSDDAATVVDATAGWAVLDVIGRDATSRLGGAGMRRRPGAPAFASSIDIGFADARCIDGADHGLPCTRLIVETDKAAHVYEHLLHAGFTAAGSWCLTTLRIENGLPGWGTEVDPTMTPEAAGLAALAGRASSPGTSELAHVRLLDPGRLLHGREPIRHEGRVIGWTVSGSFGGQDSRSSAIAYVADAAKRSAVLLDVEIEIAGESAKAILGPIVTQIG